MAKNSAAVRLGKLGGKARAEALTPAERSAISKNAARVRWDKNGESTALAEPGTAEVEHGPNQKRSGTAEEKHGPNKKKK